MAHSYEKKLNLLVKKTQVDTTHFHVSQHAPCGQGVGSGHASPECELGKASCRAAGLPPLPTLESLLDTPAQCKTRSGRGGPLQALCNSKSLETTQMSSSGDWLNKEWPIHKTEHNGERMRKLSLCRVERSQRYRK